MNFYQSLLFLHIIAGVICLLTGILAASAKKRKGRHTRTGEIYHAGYVMIFITSTLMAVMKWEENAFLFYVALFSYGLALLGYLARKIRWENWMQTHISGMLGSYIGVITAVLVVNGAAIPYLRDLPVIVLWLLPTIIGSPIIGMISYHYLSKNKLGEPVNRR